MRLMWPPMYSHFGAGVWLYDMNVDGVVNAADIATMITQEFRTMPGDFNLDGKVDMADYVVWRNSLGTGTQYQQGDANLDGVVDANDYATWRANFGFVRQAVGAGSAVGTAAVPEAESVRTRFRGNGHDHDVYEFTALDMRSQVGFFVLLQLIKIYSMQFNPLKEVLR